MHPKARLEPEYTRALRVRLLNVVDEYQKEDMPQ